MNTTKVSPLDVSPMTTLTGIGQALAGNTHKHGEKAAYETQRELFLDSCQQFSEETTFHGLRFVLKRKALFVRRALWALFVGACVSICLWQISNAISQYFQYDTVNSISIQRHVALRFPAITVCNVNQVRQSFADSFGPQVAYGLQLYLYSSFAQLDNGFDSGSLNALGGALNMTFHDFLMSAHHNASSTFLDCYHNEDFNCLDYVKPVRTAKGMCYTFNSANDTVLPLESTFSGPDGGIAIVLNAGIDEYFAPLLSDGVGFLIHIHDPQDFPLLDHGGILLAPGTDVYLSVKKQVINYLKKPYSDVNCNGDSDYSYSECRVQCMTQHVFECSTCSLLPDADNPCSFVEGGLCYLQNSPAWVNGQVKCDCPGQCEKTVYNYQLSTSKYPNQFSAQFSQTQPGWPYTTIEDIEANVLRLKIYFESITTEMVKEQPVINQWQLFSTIGGLMGLFVGCSVITLCELPDFVLVMLSKKAEMVKQKRSLQGKGVHSVFVGSGANRR